MVHVYNPRTWSTQRSHESNACIKDTLGPCLKILKNELKNSGLKHVKNCYYAYVICLYLVVKLKCNLVIWIYEGFVFIKLALSAFSKSVQY